MVFGGKALVFAIEETATGLMVPAQCCWRPKARQMKRCGVVMCGEDGDSYEGEMVVLHSTDASPAGKVASLVKELFDALCLETWFGERLFFLVFTSVED